MLFSQDNAILVVVDVQGRLAYLMHDKDSLFKNIQGIIQAARILNIPVIYTEQVPDKIGKTVPEIQQYFLTQKAIEKASFSCCGEPAFLKAIDGTKRKQIIVTGIETHVCVFQTVADLLAKKYPVQVIADAVSSRTQNNKTYALNRMKDFGADMTSTEMAITELIRTSLHPNFREILGLIR